MKKRLQGLISGVLIGTMLTSGVVFAKQISETAELFYNNIKIYIDGGEIVPKDANGNTVEPFTMNGTTYLPVRAISSALGKDVEWDGATQSVYIGKKDQTKPDNYLDRIQYNDLKMGASSSKLAKINGTISDYNNKTYTNGLIMFIADGDYRVIEDDNNESNMNIYYPLNSQYKKLSGNIVIPESYDLASWGKDKGQSEKLTDVWFYGDGKLLYKAIGVNSSMPFGFDIDVTGVNQLTVKIKVHSLGYGHGHVALTDLALYK